MIGTKKKSLLVILSLVMVLALACSALAATTINTNQTTTVSATGGAEVIVDDININVTGATGIYSYNGSSVTGSADVVTTGDSAIGAHSFQNLSVVNVTGSVETSGRSAHGVWAQRDSSVTWRGNITTSGYEGTGAYAYNNSSIDVTGNIKTSGEGAIGFRVHNTNAYGVMNGSITTTGDKAIGLNVLENAKAIMNGDVATGGYEAHGVRVTNYSTLIMDGDVATSGVRANGVHVYNNASADLTGNITTSGAFSSAACAEFLSIVTVDGNINVNGTDSYGLDSTLDGTVNMKNGTLTVADDSSAGILVEDGSVVNLTDVTTDAQNLLATTTAGTLNAEDCNNLVGDVLHGGIGGAAETLEINLKDSTLEGAILTSSGIGSLTGGIVDLDLENSTWLITGDSNTNGKVTGDIDSVIDYTEAPGETTVTIDEIVGNPTITLKPGDGLNITNSTGNNSNFSSSNPDVLEVVTDPDTGAVSIISKGEGDADLTYTYTAPNGSKHTVTVDGSSSDPHGTGSTPGSSRSGGSSSGCNAGFGALFALLGLAIVAKKK